jgi:hypothetical protein
MAYKHVKKQLKGRANMNTDTADCTDDVMTKKQFATSFVRALKHGARIAEGKEKTAGSARDFIKRVRAEVEEDTRAGR